VSRRPIQLGRSVFLVGFSGSGKSTAGKLVAERLGVAFVDTDSHIERSAGKSIAELMADDGEREFRRLEREMILGLLDRPRPSVVALGGGAFVQAAVRRSIKKQAWSIYLRCDQKELYARLRSVDDRPLLAGRGLRDRIRHLLAQRRDIYAQADFVISTTRLTPRQTAARIMDYLKERDRAN